MFHKADLNGGSYLFPAFLLLTAYHSPLTTHRSLLTTHRSLLTTHHSPHTADYSLLLQATSSSISTSSCTCSGTPAASTCRASAHR